MFQIIVCDNLVICGILYFHHFTKVVEVLLHVLSQLKLVPPERTIKLVPPHA